MVNESAYSGPKGSKLFTTVIPNGGVLNTKSVAKSFYIVESDGPLVIQAEGRLPQTYESKSGEEFSGELPENLQINNNSGADVTVTLWFGFGKYIDGRADIIGTVEITGNVPLPTGAATAAKQDAQTALLAGGLPAALSGDRLKVENVGQTPTSFFLDSAATTNATNIKAAAGTLFAIVASNINAAARFLKVYDLAVAPNVGVDVPKLTIALPASGVLPNINFGPQGMRFNNGIAIALTTLGTNADATAVAANELKVALSYI